MSQTASIRVKAAAAIASGKRLLKDNDTAGVAPEPAAMPSKSKRSKKQDGNNESNANDPSTWTRMFYQLVLFQSRNNGSSIVPDDDNECSGLAEWVRNERIFYKRYIKGEIIGMNDQQKKLQQEHISALNQIGFVFEACTKRNPPAGHQNWQSRYNELVQYKNDNDGDCNPNTSSKLGRWVNSQRMAYREYNTLLQQFQQKYPNHRPLLPEEMPRRNNSKDPKEEGMYNLITQERIQKLNALTGFQWDLAPKWTPFERRLEEYKQFQIEEGHGFIPQHYKKNPALGKWVSKIRYEYTLFQREEERQRIDDDDDNTTMGESTKRSRSQLTAERIRQLEEVGFEFSSKNQQPA